tara:strand:+ start:283127 stop:283402 length:276 start_codon:yes stop_codon:yes gene_type:complete
MSLTLTCAVTPMHRSSADWLRRKAGLLCESRSTLCAYQHIQEFQSRVFGVGDQHLWFAVPNLLQTLLRLVVETAPSRFVHSAVSLRGNIDE